MSTLFLLRDFSQERNCSFIAELTVHKIINGVLCSSPKVISKQAQRYAA